MYMALEGHYLLPPYCKILLACDVHIKKQLLILDKVRQQLYTNQSLNSFYSPRSFHRRQDVLCEAHLQAKACLGLSRSLIGL